jgi:hypothetical protein
MVKMMMMMMMMMTSLLTTGNNMLFNSVLELHGDSATECPFTTKPA